MAFNKRRTPFWPSADHLLQREPYPGSPFLTIPLTTAAQSSGLDPADATFTVPINREYIVKDPDELIN